MLKCNSDFSDALRWVQNELVRNKFVLRGETIEQDKDVHEVKDEWATKKHDGRQITRRHIAYKHTDETTALYFTKNSAKGGPARLVYVTERWLYCRMLQLRYSTTNQARKGAGAKALREAQQLADEDLESLLDRPENVLRCGMACAAYPGHGRRIRQCSLVVTGGAGLFYHNPPVLLWP